MNIRQKIISGYGCSLGLALIGTMLGLVVGDHYQQQAQNSRQIATRERQLINSLQVDILYNRPAKQLTPHVTNKFKFDQESQGLLGRIQSIEQKLAQHNSSGVPAQLEGLQPILDQYERSVAEFHTLTEQFIQDIEPLLGNADQSDRAQKMVVKLVKSPEFAAFIEFPDQLATFAALAEAREADTEVTLERAEQLRFQIIFATLVLSVAIAILLAVLTSRAIASPLQSATKIAQQITRESNFDIKVPVQSKDETRVLATAFNDLIQRVQQLLEEQKLYTAQLEIAKSAADAANHAKSDFLANMSHELRTPLNGILGYTQILTQTQLTEQQTRGINVIHQCGTHLLTLINDVLDLAKIEARKMELYPSPFYFPSMLQGVAELSRIKAEQKRVDFIAEIPSTLPSGIVADEKRLRQVLLNLLSNAIKFTDAGHVKFLVSAEKDDATDQVVIRFEIADTGVGLSETDINKIFQPFEQVGRSEHQQQGTGLGLAITQQIIQLMDSRINVQSQPGTGSSFSFEIQCPIAQDWATAKSQTQSGKIIGYRGPRRRIMVVDDHWENRAIVVNLLSPLGFELIEAENGRDALTELEDERPDLIISDLKMPILDGWSFIKTVKKSEQLHNIKIIVSSASVFAEDRQKSLDVGGSDFLPKPLDVPELYRMLMQHLEIDWIYEGQQDPSVAAVEQPTLEAGSPVVSIPSPDILMPLMALAQQGDLFNLKANIQDILASKPEYQSFLDELLELIKRFQLNQVRQRLQEGLEQGANLLEVNRQSQEADVIPT